MSRVIAPPPPVLLSPLSPTRNLPQDQVIFAVFFTADYNEFERLSLSHGKAQVFGVMLRHLN